MVACYDVKCNPPQLGNGNISCLMYADDLVLLSKSAKGMHLMLEKLHKYCTTWHLEINTKKTKVMIFRKTSKKEETSDCRFYIGKTKLSTCNKYSYLGISFRMIE